VIASRISHSPGDSRLHPVLVRVSFGLNRGIALIIALFATFGEQLIVRPDPAIVSIGEDIAWALFFDGPEQSFGRGRHWDVPLQWRIYFSSANPFGDRSRGVWTQTTARLQPDDNTRAPRGILAAAPAQEPGDYKYGVRISNARTGERLSDDDPLLIVRP
jgi:hypothetical protein